MFTRSDLSLAAPKEAEGLNPERARSFLTAEGWDVRIPAGHRMAKGCLRTRTVRRLALGLLGLAVVALAGCSRRPVTPQPLSPRQPSRPVSPTPAPADAAKAAVTDYLNALYEDDYPKAYSFLSLDSRSRHPLKEFEIDAKKTQVMYDLENAKVEHLTESRVEIVVPMEEEPGSKSFLLIKEADTWKIVYQTGKPFFPYGE